MSELKDLVGTKKLDAVDFLSKDIDSYGTLENCQVCRFRLDGVAYSAVEDPDDGYRSMMRELVENEISEMKNEFEPIDVLCKHREKDGSYGQTDDVLELIDLVTGKLILEVGTGNTDDYYPYYIANFDPTAMAINVVNPVPSK